MQPPKFADIRTRLLNLPEQDPSLMFNAVVDEYHRLTNLQHDTNLVQSVVNAVPKFMRFAKATNPLVLKSLARPPLARRILEPPNSVSRMSKRKSLHLRDGSAGLGTSPDCALTNFASVDHAGP
ncbi:hypothetical protein CSKR_200161 [Clonorchis sinensis]|uniref:Uncharacterized protein n=1 Tax=Clonorchis sinensis TaxID=79923 RepID=A0A8T1LZY0_CLOSI|nr:hypothetical protein CSKR_200161 [Clonorchis sinensis]